MASFARKLAPAEEAAFSRDAQSKSDLIMLDEVSSAAITKELAARYAKGEIYTSIGPVLIAVNPYKVLHKAGGSIYRDEVARREEINRRGKPPRRSGRQTLLRGRGCILRQALLLWSCSVKNKWYNYAFRDPGSQVPKQIISERL